VYDVPDHIDDMVARLKLETLGIRVDRLTKEQQAYVRSWREGT
jgi:adenosylhomocysteinase